jgi:hypothetical protein
MVYQTIEIGIDGLLAISEKGGLIQYFCHSDGNTADVVLITEKGELKDTFTLADAKTDGYGKNSLWDQEPKRMLRVYAIKKALRKHFAEIIAAAEKELRGN